TDGAAARQRAAAVNVQARGSSTDAAAGIGYVEYATVGDHDTAGEGVANGQDQLRLRATHFEQPRAGQRSIEGLDRPGVSARDAERSRVGGRTDECSVDGHRTAIDAAINRATETAVGNV